MPGKTVKASIGKTWAAICGTPSGTALYAVAISKRLGHAKVSTTQNIYAHFIEEADEQSVESIADAVFRTPKKPASNPNTFLAKTAF